MVTPILENRSNRGRPDSMLVTVVLDAPLKRLHLDLGQDASGFTGNWISLDRKVAASAALLANLNARTSPAGSQQGKV
jgi:hypothetical protein